VPPVGITPTRDGGTPILGPDALDGDHRLKLALNCTLLRRGDEITLIDTGMGDKHDRRVKERLFPGDYGYLLDALSGLGISPSDVTSVINTHLHADHCGWNTVRRDELLKPTFPNARYCVQTREFESASAPNERTRGTYFPENFEPLESSGRLELIDGERPIATGIHFLPAPGHTRHHAAVVITSGRDTAIHSGDLVHHPVQLERLAWIPAFDEAPLDSLETKRRLLGRAVAENALLISPHIEFPGTGRLIEEGRKRRFVPEPSLEPPKPGAA